MPKLEPDIEKALAHLARSKFGRQGIGFVKSSKIAMRLFQLGHARAVKSNERNLCAVTLDGFRYLEQRRLEEENEGGQQ